MIIQTGGGACGSFRVSTHAPFRHDGNRFHRHFLWMFHTEFNGIVDFREGEGGREGGRVRDTRFGLQRRLLRLFLLMEFRNTRVVTGWP